MGVLPHKDARSARDHFLSKQKDTAKVVACHFYLGFLLFAELFKQKYQVKLAAFLPEPLLATDWAKLTPIFTWFKSRSKVTVP